MQIPTLSTFGPNISLSYFNLIQHSSKGEKLRKTECEERWELKGAEKRRMSRAAGVRDGVKPHVKSLGIGFVAGGDEMIHTVYI